MATVFELYSEYYRKKWFPDKYQDALGELVDYINESVIRDLIQKAQSEKNHGLQQIALELFKLLPVRKFPDLYRDYIRVYQESLAPANCRPEFAYSHLRKLPNDQRSELWTNLLDWAKRTQSRMHDWHHARIDLEKSFPEFGTEKSVIDKISNWLTSTRESFELEFPTKSFPDAIASFRMAEWDETFDWNDFPGLARSFLNSCLFQKHPLIRKSTIDDSVQFCFPIFPPDEVVVEHGTAAGPADAFRFIQQVAKGCFYAHFNPQLPTEFRFTGDERLIHFWSSLYTLPLMRKTGLKIIIGQAAENLAPQMESRSRFWYRYDAFLAVYKHAAENDFENVEDHFVERWRDAFHFDLPRSLFLFEFDHSTGTAAQIVAFDAALVAEEKLRTKYGNAWFASPQWASKLRSYWWEGFSLNLEDTINSMP